MLDIDTYNLFSITLLSTYIFKCFAFRPTLISRFLNLKNLNSWNLTSNKTTTKNIFLVCFFYQCEVF